jgi:uncharacterized protein HemY
VLGLILGGIAGFAGGLLLGMALKSKEKRSIKKESKAERIFKLAIQQKSQERKLELLGRILDKHPKSEWADKALEEAMKITKGKSEE